MGFRTEDWGAIASGASDGMDAASNRQSQAVDRDRVREINEGRKQARERTKFENERDDDEKTALDSGYANRPDWPKFKKVVMDGGGRPPIELEEMAPGQQGPGAPILAAGSQSAAPAPAPTQALPVEQAPVTEYEAYTGPENEAYVMGPQPLPPLDQAADGGQIDVALPVGGAQSDGREMQQALPEQPQDEHAGMRAKREEYNSWKREMENLAMNAGGMEGVKDFQGMEQERLRMESLQLSGAAIQAYSKGNVKEAKRLMNEYAFRQPVDLGYTWDIDPTNEKAPLMMVGADGETSPYQPDELFQHQRNTLSTPDNYTEMLQQSMDLEMHPYNMDLITAQTEQALSAADYNRAGRPASTSDRYGKLSVDDKQWESIRKQEGLTGVKASEFDPIESIGRQLRQRFPNASVAELADRARAIIATQQ